LKKICVLGSLNIDMTLSVPYFNQPGESLTGTGLAIYTGGKGGNQAVAAARLGASVSMIGCLGADANGAMYRDRLAAEGVDVSGVALAPDVPSGTAFIEVIPSGENRIAVARGANDALTVEMVRAHEPLIASAGIFMAQLEMPLEVILEGLRIARAHGCLTILDPAPACPVPDGLLALCDVVTPNETELAILTGLPVNTVDEAVTAARALIARGAPLVINKRGASGALCVTADGFSLHPSYPVAAVDTTAAGDSFNAGLAHALSRAVPLPDAIAWANAVGALSTTLPGAQSAMPASAQVQAFLGRCAGSP